MAFNISLHVYRNEFNIWFSMKKFILFMLPFLGIYTLDSHEFEVRIAYFRPDNSRIKKNFNQNSVEYEVEATTPLRNCIKTLRRYDAFANIGFYQLDSRQHLDLKNWTLVAGLKRYYGALDACCNPYLGLGYGAVNTDFHNSKHFSKKHRNRWGHALLAKSGIKYKMTEHFFLDLFVDYSYHSFRHERNSDHDCHSVNTGGWLAGVGLGYQY